MKKLITIIAMILCAFICTASTTYTVETNNGTQQVIIPDGMTETDVLLKLATAYYNLSYEYDSLKEETEELTVKVEDYITANKDLRVKYDALISDYELLTKRYDNLNKFKWAQGSVGGLMIIGESGIKGAGVYLGGTFFQKVDVFVQFQYPVALSVGLAYRF